MEQGCRSLPAGRGGRDLYCALPVGHPMGTQEEPDLVPGKVPPGHGPGRPAKENLSDTHGFLHPQVNFQLCNREEAGLAASAWRPGLRGRALLSEAEGLWRGRTGAPGWGLQAAGRCVVRGRLLQAGPCFPDHCLRMVPAGPDGRCAGRDTL